MELAPLALGAGARDEGVFGSALNPAGGVLNFEFSNPIL